MPIRRQTGDWTRDEQLAEAEVMVATARRDTGRGGWPRTPRYSAAPHVRVVCFPYSGDSAGGFAEWAELGPPRVELIGVRYPGRGDRFAESAVQLADLVADALDGTSLAGPGTDGSPARGTQIKAACAGGAA